MRFEASILMDDWFFSPMTSQVVINMQNGRTILEYKPTLTRNSKQRKKWIWKQNPTNWFFNYSIISMVWSSFVHSKISTVDWIHFSTNNIDIISSTANRYQNDIFHRLLIEWELCVSPMMMKLQNKSIYSRRNYGSNNWLNYDQWSCLVLNRVDHYQKC